MPKKTRTLDQIEAMQEKAVRFLQDVVGDPERAEEFAAMSPEEYAEHKWITIENPTTKRRPPMRRPTYTELKERVTELEEENQTLSEKLDSIVDIASEEEEEDEEEDDDEEDEELE